MLITEYLIRGRVESQETQVSVGLIVGGAVIAGWETVVGGITSESLGMAFTVLNNVLTAWSHSQSKAFADKWNCHGCVVPAPRARARVGRARRVPLTRRSPSSRPPRACPPPASASCSTTR